MKGAEPNASNVKTHTFSAIQLAHTYVPNWMDTSHPVFKCGEEVTLKHKTLPVFSSQATLSTCLVLLLFFAWVPQTVLAQGEGPRTYLPAPAGTNVLSATWMDMESNMNFAGSILIPDAEITSTIVAVNYNRYFSLANRLVEIWVTGIGGEVNGSTTAEPFRGSSVGISGIADPYFAMRVGLLGAPALDLATFMQTPPGFQVYALAGVTMPWGDYKQNRPLNLGTNRWSLRLGLPVVMPLGKKPGTTWLEVHPNVYFFGDNDEPFQANKREQDALYVVESHLTHNFTSKFWAGLDLRYQHGGETTTDHVNDDNKVNRWGGGAAAGYAFTRSWSGFISYGEVINESDNSKMDMWRARLIFVY